MNARSKLGLGAALLALVAACGTDDPSVDNQALGNGLNVMDNGMIVDPEIPSAPVETNAAAAEPASEPAAVNEPAAVKVAPVPPPRPKAPPKAKTGAEAPMPKAPPPVPDPHAGHDMNEM